ncbi:MAG: bifunctional (p)ppGpp synthetase/guanosine-3',5'-bis(diphosphate) 3'-pyrophosphohydrolase [Alphaproteobacteria bacterium]|nr:bifunctional (p)ppGpp synthetase/guanosine-3',5'-bis(diphosphate) 3'-pyrophosphohydrolase [Alphaproteobacteria bacterium]
MTAAYTTRLDDATALVVEAFRDSFRKGTTVPYVTHLFAVMALVGEAGGDEDQLVAALLHDYLEDVDPDGAPGLRARFGDRVADLVVGLSDALEHPKPPWQARKDRYLAHLRVAHPDLKLISAADKLHNCRTIRADLAVAGPVVFDRFTAGRDGTLWYYRAVVEALGHGWSHPLLDRLAAEVDGLHADADQPPR